MREIKLADRRARLMRSGRGVLMLGAHPQRFEDQELFDVKMDSRCPLDQLRRDEDLHVVLLDGLVRSEVLAFEVGVDRHLCGAVSGKWRNEVERHRPPALLRECHCFVANRDVHHVLLVIGCSQHRWL